jgi:hypothetical protein
MGTSSLWQNQMPTPLSTSTWIVPVIMTTTLPHM